MQSAEGRLTVIGLSILNIMVPMVAGILVGYFLRKKREVDLSKVVLGTIVVLMFSLGFTVGSNGELLNSIYDVGLEALLMSSLTMGFSVLLVWLFRRKAGIE